MACMKFSSVASLVLLAMVCSRITVLAFDDALAPLPAMATCFLFGFVCRYGIFSYVLFI
ncbi:hypothetical protein NC653_022985 [Populus alba x Populus x berolinensis]|uniref:Uncharacterized protein n=1 Tax=Populus alba x Populus x berolinensis TaxID=444605 RepID=A0AAD6MG12_9ROSI|nr:hypothetical protein NC653_022985 [Populus alba x Populus x berolinensis]